jgi:hypothetical protein
VRTEKSAHRRRGAILVAGRQGVVGLFQQGTEVHRQQVGFRRRRHDLEPPGRDGLEGGELVQQVEGVLVPDVIGIPREGPLQAGPAALDVAEPELIDA